ncbi:unnamed protein product [Calicophoron daubneyi]|uniref:Peregrin n=1 Tax=Calicophoron daubneyi TaxID=300641 RepID=A0AAV2T0Y7_CALDB
MEALAVDQHEGGEIDAVDICQQTRWMLNPRACHTTNMQVALSNILFESVAVNTGGLAERGPFKKAAVFLPYGLVGSKKMVYHPVDFDIDDFLSRIHGNKPPFMCPADACKKVYKSYAHIQKHMLIHRPPAPIDIPATPLDLSRTVNSGPLSVSVGLGSNKVCPSSRHNGTAWGFPVYKSTNAMILNDPLYSVLFEAIPFGHGQTFRCSIFVPLTFRMENSPHSAMSNHTLQDVSRNHVQSGAGDSTHLPEFARKTPSKRSKTKTRRSTMHFNTSNEVNGHVSDLEGNKNSSLDLSSKHDVANSENTEEKAVTRLNTPKPQFEIDPEFVYRKPVALKEGHGYIRFIEKSPDELDEIVEYDLDEEDLFWLHRMNASRGSQGLSPVKEATLEWIMDRFEKEAKFHTVSSSGQSTADAYTSSLGQSGIDEDAVCAVCQDGSCENTNVILFCDVCNLAVHQECYGVPYVPEGPWLCRKCLHSPSQPVSCVLCPNRGGAFKKTSDDRWAHVICGLWIPEVMFANLTFLEPLEGIDRIAPARWRLQCFICKQRNVGACIQCHKTSCYRAFHVTCAQHAGLYMKIEHTDEPGDAGIRKSAFCDRHCPPNHFAGANKSMYANSDSENPQSPEQAARIQLRKARKVLAERRNSQPSVCVPIVPKAKVDLICSELTDVSGDVMDFLGKVYAFWKLKREFRRGVPLLKRLQASSIHRSAASFAAAAATGDAESQRMRQQLQFWQQLRQDLEKARLLSELTRKRERLKRDVFRLFTTEIELQIQSIHVFLLRLLDQLQSLDKQGFFAEPVTSELAPDYHLIIDHPMDFSTMRTKIHQSKYTKISEFEADYKLMLDNCFQYNRRDSIYCTAASRMAEQGKKLFETAYSVAKEIGLSPRTGMMNVDVNDISSAEKSDLIVGDHSLERGEECGTSVVDEQRINGILEETTNLIDGPLLEPSNTAYKTEMLAKEAITCEFPGEQRPVASSTRSRLRSLSSIQNTQDAACNGHFSSSEVRPRRSRKRRLTMVDDHVDPHSVGPDTDSCRPAKQEKLDLSTSLGSGVQWPNQTKVTDLFSQQPVSSILTSRTMGSKWTNSCSSKLVNCDTAANLLSRGSGPCSPRNGLHSSLAELNGVALTRNGPAFTCYRLNRAARCDDEEDEEEEEEDDDETEESDEESDDGQTSSSAQTALCTQQDENSPLTCKHIRSSPKLSTHPMVVTTVVGKSRMAAAATADPSDISSTASNIMAKTNNTNLRQKRLPVRRKPSSFDRSHYPRRTRVLRPHHAAPATRNKRHTSRGAKRSGSPRKATASLHSPSNNEEIHKPLQLRDLTSSSITTDFSDALSHIESPGPLSASTSVAQYELPNQTTDLLYPIAGSPSARGRLSSCMSGDSSNTRHFSPLDVVWAKCRGSPWYPALVVDPGADEGYSHNGVPIPVPPEPVLNWGKRIASTKVTEDEKPDMLVLFFDTKRTWQWLSEQKLQPLGLTVDLDRERLQEGKRSKMKHSVIKAYHRAVEHLCKVYGRPYPFLDTKPGDVVAFTL